MVAPKYAEWMQRWAAGMEAAQPYMDARRRAAQGMAVANRGRLGPCGITGCKHNAYKGRLCRAHYALVPVDERIKVQVAAMMASMRVAKRGQARYIGIVRRILAEKSP